MTADRVPATAAHACPAALAPARAPALAAGARRAAWRLALLLCGLWLACGAAPAEVIAEGDAIKAAYLLRFAGYVEWPPRVFAGPDSPLVVGVAGDEGVLWQLATLARERTGDSRPTVVRGLAPGDPLDGVHILFVGTAAALPPGWLERAHEHGVLVVTDSPRGLAEGGVLNFVLQDQRIRFEASIPAAEQSGLKLSARLLAVAARVVAPQ